MISKEQLRKELYYIISNAIREDVGDGDHSSLACIPAETNGKAKLLVKDEGIIAGVEFAKMIFAYVDEKENHRFALYDMIMLKDNHIDFAGGITKAIKKTQAYLKETNRDLKIIVEARNLKEIEEILKSDGVYRILIDNFNYEDTRTAVAMIGDQCLTESSGGINEKTLRKYADCGVDYISSGALTHSVYNMDLSLKAV